MQTLRMKEGEIEIPSGWEDKTIHVLSFPVGAKESDASFTVTRARLEENDSLKAYIDLQLVKIAKMFPRFSMISRDQVTVDGQEAEHLVFTWRSEKGVTLRQEQTVIALADEKVLVLTATATKDAYHLHADAFCGMVTQFRFHRN
ncbi:MAG: DcrB-related protein [Geobacteraceae bacterium]|nr:DcrB-related protein [Geobacteraceae bacterium]